jgi:hypothetical protein
MDEMTAFDRQVSAAFGRLVGPARPVDDAAIFATITTTRRYPVRRTLSLSSAPLVIAGVIVGLVGGGLLLTAGSQPRTSDPVAAVGSSPSASPAVIPFASLQPSPGPSVLPSAEPAITMRSDLLPGVRLSTQQTRPGVFQVLGDGIRDLRPEGKVRGAAVDADGHVWVLRGGAGYWAVDQLGKVDAGIRALRVPKATLSTDPDGTLRVRGGNHDLVLRDGAWVTDGSQVKQPAAQTSCPDGVRLLDGDCWRISADGTHLERRVAGHWRLQGNHALRLPSNKRLDDQIRNNDLPVHLVVDGLTVGSDGIGWATVRWCENGCQFYGLIRYDGKDWTTIPYPEVGGGPSGTADLSVAPDGSVWILEASLGGPRVRGWTGGTSWKFAWSDRKTLRAGGVDLPWRWASQDRSGTTHFVPDGDIWFLEDQLVFDGQALRPLGLPRGRPSFSRDGTAWIVSGTGKDRRLYVVDLDTVVARG